MKYTTKKECIGIQNVNAVYSIVYDECFRELFSETTEFFFRNGKIDVKIVRPEERLTPVGKLEIKLVKLTCPLNKWK